MPFAGYEDFDECVRRNRDKGNPQAYCGAIKHKTEGKSANVNLLKGKIHIGHVVRRGNDIKVNPPKVEDGDVVIGHAYRDEKGRITIENEYRKAAAVDGTFDTRLGQFRYGRSRKREEWKEELDRKAAASEQKRTGALKPTAGIAGPVEENVGGKCAHLCSACVTPDVMKAKLVTMLADWDSAEHIVMKILQSEDLGDLTCNHIKGIVEKESLIEQDWSYDGLKIEKLAHEDDGSLIIAGHAQFTHHPSGEELDNDGEVVDIGSLKSCFLDYIKNPIVRFMHGKDYIKHAVGRVIPEYIAKDGTVYKTHFDKFPYLVIKISNAPDTASIRKKIEEGILTGLSIGGKLLKKITDFNKRTGEKFPRVFVKSWLETSIVDMPSNKGAFFQVISKCAGINMEKYKGSALTLLDKKRLANQPNPYQDGTSEYAEWEKEYSQYRKKQLQKFIKIEKGEYEDKQRGALYSRFRPRTGDVDVISTEGSASPKMIVRRWLKGQKSKKLKEVPIMLSSHSNLEKSTDFGTAIYIFKDLADWNLEASEEKGQRAAMREEAARKVMTGYEPKTRPRQSRLRRLRAEKAEDKGKLRSLFGTKSSQSDFEKIRREGGHNIYRERFIAERKKQAEMIEQAAINRHGKTINELSDDEFYEIASDVGLSREGKRAIKSSQSNFEKVWRHAPRPYSVYTRDGQFVASHTNPAEAERHAAKIGGTVKTSTSKSTEFGTIIYKFPVIASEETR